MTAYDIPSLLVDPQTLPPLILTSEPGSFANYTLGVRVPRIIEETLELNQFPDEIRRAVEGLRGEILHGRIRELREATPDREFWNMLSRDFIGHTWLDVPWYWAESYFYRRMLEATGYFQPGPGYLVDPYRAAKRSELLPAAAPQKVAALLRSLPSDADDRFRMLLHASLWGNRIDLSYKVSAEFGRGERSQDQSQYVLIDDSEAVLEYVKSSSPGIIALVEDNAGTELLTDLVLVDFLLGENRADKVILQLKPQPFFVSDAMPGDVQQGLEALQLDGGEARTLAARIQGYEAQGRLGLETHWFYPTCLFYFQMPEDLIRSLRSSKLVILKGDANYRRLLGDAHWDLTTPFGYVTRYFPSPLVALRTFKSEELVGLPPGVGPRLGETDPDWLINGKRGVVQARL